MTNKERPILFNGEMVRALLDGRKTQTRRVIKPQVDVYYHQGNLPELMKKCPFGQVGDRLWVRETWAKDGLLSPYWYKADGYLTWQGAWKPSVHMPREASRINLEITGVRVERLQDISEEDAIAEGVRPEAAKYQPDLSNWSFDVIGEFIGIWDSTNAKKNPWVSNPWVWVIEFAMVGGES